MSVELKKVIVTRILRTETLSENSIEIEFEISPEDDHAHISLAGSIFRIKVDDPRYCPAVQIGQPFLIKLVPAS